MAQKKSKSIIDEVKDYITDINSDEVAVDIISNLYQMVVELARENGALEHENALLERQINIAEAWILSEHKDDKDPDDEPHFFS